jgi:LysM repeat protein
VSGDTCSGIAAANNVALDALLAANNLTLDSCTSLQVGQVLKIP